MSYSDRDCARFSQLWEMMSDAEKDRMFPSLDENWQHAFAGSSPVLATEEQQVQRGDAGRDLDALEQQQRHRQWLQLHAHEAPDPYSY